MELQQLIATLQSIGGYIRIVMEHSEMYWCSIALTFWADLRPNTSKDETRQMLKIQSRLFERTLNTSIAQRNGLIVLLDQSFPEASYLFTTKSDIVLIFEMD